MEKIYGNLMQDCEHRDNVYVRALHKEDYRIFDMTQHFDLYNMIDDEKLKIFLLMNKKCIVIPLKFVNGITYGYVLRSLRDKKFYVYEIVEKYPVCYGLHDFDDYAYDTPILLCEGIKDRQVLKRVWKYSIAYLKAKPDERLWDFLNKVSKNIIFFPDKDKTGFSLEKDKRFVGNHKFYAPTGKDLGRYYDKNDENVLDWVMLCLDKVYAVDLS